MNFGLVLLVALASVVSAQDVDETAPDLDLVADIACPVPIDVVYGDLTAEEVETAKRLESGADTVEDYEARRTAAVPGNIILPPIIKCENGPVKVPHTVPNEWHYPQLSKGSCGNLACTDPPCLVKTSVKICRCVWVWQFVKGRWIFIGIRQRCFLSARECECKQCKHIRVQHDCVNTFPCPSNKNCNSHCIWRPFFLAADPVLANATAVSITRPIPIPIGRCDCCDRVACKFPKIFDFEQCRCICPGPIPHCPLWQTYNPNTCRCECQPGWLVDAKGVCSLPVPIDIADPPADTA